MKRRTFLHSTAVTSALALVNLASPAKVQTAKASTNSEPADFELDEMSITELQQHMQSGRFSARSLVEKYISRINEIDKAGPSLNSIIELNPDAESIAANLDRERKDKGARGPLHGIPVLIKDNIDTADRLMTTAGSLALVGSKPSQDAFI